MENSASRTRSVVGRVAVPRRHRVSLRVHRPGPAMILGIMSARAIRRRRAADRRSPASARPGVAEVAVIARYSVRRSARGLVDQLGVAEHPQQPQAAAPAGLGWRPACRPRGAARGRSRPARTRPGAGDRLEPLARRAVRLGAADQQAHARMRCRDRPGRAAGAAGRSRSGRRRRSPSSVAFGTSTPTSITVVATSTSVCPPRTGPSPPPSRRRPAGRAASPTRTPCSGPALELGDRSSTAAGAARRATAVAGVVEVLAVARRPAGSSGDARGDDVRLATRGHLLEDPLQARSSHPGLAAVRRPRAWPSATGPRAAPDSVEISRSPNTVMATERGIGVAVMTSTCGRASRLRAQCLALLHAEAVLLVHDDQPQVGELHAARRAARGCRPRCPASPEAASSSASRRAAAGIEPVSSTTSVRSVGAPSSRRRPAGRAAPRSSGGAGRPAPRSGPAARPVRRRRPPGASPAGPPPSCRSRPRPAAGAASGAAAPARSMISCADLALPGGERERQPGVEGVQQAAGHRAAGDRAVRGRRRPAGAPWSAAAEGLVEAQPARGRLRSRLGPRLVHRPPGREQLGHPGFAADLTSGNGSAHHRPGSPRPCGRKRRWSRSAASRWPGRAR